MVLFFIYKDAILDRSLIYNACLWAELVIRVFWHFRSVNHSGCLTLFFQFSKEIQDILEIMCWSPFVVQSVFKKSWHVTAGQWMKKCVKWFVTYTERRGRLCRVVSRCSVSLVRTTHYMTVCTTCCFCFQVSKIVSPLTQWHLCPLPIGSGFLSSCPFIQNFFLLSAVRGQSCLHLLLGI